MLNGKFAKLKSANHQNLAIHKILALQIFPLYGINHLNDILINKYPFVFTCFCLVIMSQSSTSDFLIPSGNSILTSGLEGEESL